ncbi:MAG: hypothetical protein C3F06_07300 [Candidatus Methanoperedenaceae archaeon]|nr:MAG: hypothetical protein C3F06_07300 [Candidatus Methanoperedenaceae archaeon]
MAKIKTSIALDEDMLKWVDTQIEKKRFANRTHAIEFVLQQLIEGEKPIARTNYIQPSKDLGLAIAESLGKTSSNKKR